MVVEYHWPVSAAESVWSAEQLDNLMGPGYCGACLAAHGISHCEGAAWVRNFGLNVLRESMGTSGEHAFLSAAIFKCVREV